MLGDQKSGNNIISTHALTEGDSRKSSSIAYGNISTHALTEGDQYGYHACWEIHISTHALTEGDKRSACFSD